MSELGSTTRALLAAARSARPTSSARTRMGVALEARLGMASLGAPSSTGAPQVAPPGTASPLGVAATAWPLAKAALIGVALAVIPAAAIVVAPERPTEGQHAHRTPTQEASPRFMVPDKARLHADDPPTQETAAPPTVRVATPLPPALAEVPKPPRRVADPPVIAAIPVESPQPPASSGLGQTEGSSPARDVSLEEDTAVLREVQRSLTQRDGARALDLLDNLAARHPAGVLREERLAARVFALCAAGRVNEAREAGKRFVAELPASVQVVRVRASCAFSGTTSK